MQVTYTTLLWPSQTRANNGKTLDSHLAVLRATWPIATESVLTNLTVRRAAGDNEKQQVILNWLGRARMQITACTVK